MESPQDSQFLCSEGDRAEVYSPIGKSHGWGLRADGAAYKTCVEITVKGAAEVLSTVMAEAVNVVNSRPLTRSNSDVAGPEVLTPNNLLHLRPNSKWYRRECLVKKIFTVVVDGGKRNTCRMCFGRGWSRSIYSP